MNHAMDQIEAGIERTRSSVGSGLRTLEHTAADWQEHVRARPWAMLAAAGVCGFVLGATLRPHADDGHEGISHSPVVGQLSPLLDDIAEALVAVATAGVKGVIDNVVPGFKDHLARIEERAGSR